MLIGNKHNLQKVRAKSIVVDNIEIKSVDKVKNLGVISDKTMNMEPQVKNMCKKAYFNIRNIAHIRKSLSKEDTKTAVHALVTPHFDYGNALLYGSNKRSLDKLQVAQNSAARLIERLRKHDRISHVRKELHWLPIHARINFKILNMTWKALNNESPQYITNLLNKSVAAYNSRSNHQNLLKIPRCVSSFGEKAFSFIAPKIWNNLPHDIRHAGTNDIFRNKLKTHLFHNSYLDP
jgi:hypothetical protein